MADIEKLRQLDGTAISRLFCDYVSGMADKPRHTVQADLEVDIFDQFLAGAFPHNAKLHNKLYDRMMSVAVEFEESGFISGFRYALALLIGQELDSSEPEQIPTVETGKTAHEALTGSHEQIQMVDSVGTDCITTKQIAEMFGTTNFKVVRRIEKQILPYLDQESQKFFCRVEGCNIQHKPVVFYKLNRAACQMYLQSVETKKKSFINIAGGYAKLQELMEKVFPSDMRVASA